MNLLRGDIACLVSLRQGMVQIFGSCKNSVQGSSHFSGRNRDSIDGGILPALSLWRQRKYE